MNVIDMLGERFIITPTIDLSEHFSTRRTLFARFAPVPSLDVDHLFLLTTLRRFADAGHDVVALIDKACCDSTYDLVENSRRTRAQIMSFLGDRVFFVNNTTWFRGLKYLEVIRDFGTFFTVNNMLRSDIYRSRREEGGPLSFLEFNQLVMRALDSYFMFEQKCAVQIGYDNDWGTMYAGVELLRLKDNAVAFAVGLQVLFDETKKKVWLDKTMTSPYEFYQFWRNIDDAYIAKMLASFTDLSLTEISAGSSVEEKNAYKTGLAWHMTALCHGEEDADKAHAQAQSAFYGRGDSAPEVEVSMNHATALLIDILAATGLESSKGAARRLAQQGGLQVNGEKVNEKALVMVEELEVGVLVQLGKKRIYRLKLAAV